MYIVGITGPIGAGKTLAMQALQSPGILMLDCDELYRELLSSNTQMQNEISGRFPSSLENGIISRKKLGDIVFNDPAALTDLNRITHKYVLSDVDARISMHEKQGGSAVVISAISLIESGLSERCNTVICVTAPVETRISRITERDKLSGKEALTRIRAQKPDDFYKENSTLILENDYADTKDFALACRRAYLIDEWFHRHTDEMVAELGRLVAINSVRSKSADGAPYGKASRKALSLAQKLLEKHGFAVNVFEDMVITASLGTNPPKLGILTHLDIVEAGDGWGTDPFKLICKDGRLFGRGVMDNKGPAIASMFAVYCISELFPNLKDGVQLIFGSGEETGFEDIANYAKKNTLPPNVFSPDSEFPVVNTEKGRLMCSFCAKWEKDKKLPRIISIQGGKTPNIVPNHAVAVIGGISKNDAEMFCKEYSEKTGVLLSAEPQSASNAAADCGNILFVTAKGTAAHASRPHLGSNAQTALIQMLAAMPFADSRGFTHIRTLARLFPHGDYYGNAVCLDSEDEISGKTTVNFGVLRYDELEFSAGFDARTAVCADKTDVLETARGVLKREGMDVIFHEHKPSHHTPDETPFVQSLLRIYEQYTGKEGKCLCVGGLTYVHDIPGGVAFGCTMTEDDNNVHGANEYIDIKELVNNAKMFAQVILEVCKTS